MPAPDKPHPHNRLLLPGGLQAGGRLLPPATGSVSRDWGGRYAFWGFCIEKYYVVTFYLYTLARPDLDLDGEYTSFELRQLLLSPQPSQHAALPVVRRGRLRTVAVHETVRAREPPVRTRPPPATRAALSFYSNRSTLPMAAIGCHPVVITVYFPYLHHNLAVIAVIFGRNASAAPN
jgi:hypothetical protein